jgi:hypothetical protein
VSIILGGSANLPLQKIDGMTIAPTTPINCDTSLGTAATQVQMLADYTMATAALSRPAVCFPASLTFPLTITNGTRVQFALCEALALMAAGAARNA